MQKIIKCKENDQLIELPCSASECNYFGDCLAEYEKTQEKTMTHGDRIRAMSDEELAELVGKYVYCGLCPLKHRCVPGECNKTVMKWLKQPAEVK